MSARFDDIVDFAEIGDAVDRQVKFYSTGMAIRLGFAIAAFLEPDVLLVDEVLAVGDARFQQKCLERISQVVANGTTLFYVSHDLPTVEAVCDRAMWLADSYVRADGPARDVVSLYRQSVGEQAVLAADADTGVRLLKVEVTGPDGGQVLSGEEVQRPHRGRVRGAHVRGLPSRRLPGHGHAGVRDPLRQLVPAGAVRAAVPDAEPAPSQGPVLVVGGDAGAT